METYKEVEIRLHPFSGSSAKQLRKATTSLVMSIRPFVCPHGKMGNTPGGFS
jgi:hypothetical protein